MSEKNKQLRVIHAAFTNQRVPGIESQMRYEEGAVGRLNLAWGVIYHSRERVEHRNIIFKAIYWIRSQRLFLNDLLQKSRNVEVLLLRYTPGLVLLVPFLIQVKKPVLLVHHTKSRFELLSTKDAAKFIQYIADLFFSSLIHGLASGTVSVTREISDSLPRTSNLKQKPKLIYPNGIDPELEVVEDKRRSIPTMLFVASRFERWHGLDLLIEDARFLTEEFLVHIVGEVSKTDEENLRFNSKFVTHGKLTQEEVRKIASRCHIGITSHALFRKRMNEACTLKTREYLIWGLPCIGDHRESLPTDFPYYARNTEGLKGIFDFSKKMQRVNRSAVRREALQYISKDQIVRSLYLELNSHFGDSDKN